MKSNRLGYYKHIQATLTGVKLECLGEKLGCLGGKLPPCPPPPPLDRTLHGSLHVCNVDLFMYMYMLICFNRHISLLCYETKELKESDEPAQSTCTYVHLTGCMLLTVANCTDTRTGWNKSIQSPEKIRKITVMSLHVYL